ncbi:murein biosynthesis integral membrane protein MurJ [Candidatus Fermentibacterales bacterium]|nr:murein biosynthesis integral membrane protein MurJ [Candidatus Fermentibacterales bacterium]
MRRLLGRLASEKGRLSGFSIMSAGNLLVALLTYLRQAEIARIFGATWQTDAYAVALVFPMLAQQVVSHAFGSSFIPIYAAVMHGKGKRAADLLVSRILCWIGLAGLLVVTLLLVTSRALVTAAGPGLSSTTLDLSSSMLRIMLPILVLSSLSGILNGIVTYRKRFGLVSMLNVLNILVALVVLLVGHGRYGIMVLPLSGLAAAIVVFCASLFLALRLGARVHPMLDPREEDFHRLLGLAAPVVLGSLVGFLGPVADKILASFLKESSVTALEYAVRIKNIAMSLLFMPMVALSDVGLSRKAAEGDIGAFRSEMYDLLNWTSIIMLPCAALLSALAIPIVSVLFMRGSFGLQDARLVGYALAFYAPWLAQFGFGSVVSRGFYALKDSKTPVLIGIWGVAANVLLNIILIGPLGIGGLALATTVSSAAKTVLLTWFIRKKTGSSGWRAVVVEHVRLLSSTALMTLTAVLLMRVLPAGLEEPLLTRLAHLGIWMVPSLGVYLAALRMLGSTTLARLATRIGMSGRGGNTLQ